MTKPSGNSQGTKARTLIFPPPIPPRIPEKTEAEVLRLSAETFGCKTIARMTGISHTSVLRIWARRGVNRVILQRRARIVAEHKSLATRIAKSVAHELPMQLREDLAAVAVAELAKLADIYDPSTGVPFGAFAQRRIRGACVDSIRRRHYTNGTASELTSEDAEARADKTESAEDALIDEQQRGMQRSEMAGAVLKLPGRLAVVAWLHYFEDRKIEQIATQIGVGPSRVSQLHTEALGILRQNMGAKAKAAGAGL